MAGRRALTACVVVAAAAAIAVPALAAPPPDGPSGRIAFVSYRAGNHEIYIARPDAAAPPRRLTFNAAMDLHPSLSLTGERIVFASDRTRRGVSSAYEIYSMNADGGAVTRLTSNDVEDSHPALSPDGRRVAFMRDGDIWTMDADGANQEQRTHTTARENQPAFSPDGATITFTRDVSNNLDVYTMSANGGIATRLTDDLNDDKDPTFAPDGKRIAFTSARDERYQIYTMTAEGADEKRLVSTRTDDLEPSYSPDGMHIAFTRGWPGEVVVMRADGRGSATNVSNSADDDDQPSWGGAPLAACSPGEEEVAIYEDPGYRGRCVVRGTGTYDNASVFAPLPNNSASSIQVGKDVAALLAEGTRLGGKTEKFLSSDPDLSDNPNTNRDAIGVNTMSSFKVRYIPQYTALGDSISSGEGLFKYVKKTNVNGGNQCHRARRSTIEGLPGAYPNQIESRLHEQDLRQFNFSACSGAVIAHILHPGLFGEPAQIDSVNEDTTLVTITIGANDLDVWGIGIRCFDRNDTKPPCHTLEDEEVQKRIEDMKGTSTERFAIEDLPKVYAAIKHEAPKARIMVLGYPRLFPKGYRNPSGDPTKPESDCVFRVLGIAAGSIDPADINWMNDITHELNEAIKASATAAGVEYVDTYDAFAGHEQCSPNTPWINGVVSRDRENPDAETLHPNANGQKALTERLWTAMQ